MSTPAPTTLAPTTPPAPTSPIPTTAVAPTTPSTTGTPTTLAPTTTLTTLAPTTGAPTTAVPIATTVVPGTMITSTAPGTAAPGTSAPAQIEYPANLIVYPGPIEINLSLHGEILNKTVFVQPLVINISLLGSYAEDVYIDIGPIVISVSLHSDGTLVGIRKCNWVQWSKIGHLDFTKDESNVAGERPLDWKGCVSEILKLVDRVIVYGENGVSMMAPSGVNWGMQTIHDLGVVCKPVGTKTEHFFIDKTNKLYKVAGDGIKLLDYSEYLSLLTNPRMNLDPETGIIYICDGEYGFVYSTKSGSFGAGPVNVTGVGSQSGTLYVVAPAEIEVPKLHICTDIYDLGTRKPKTIQWIEIGTDLSNGLQAMVESRISNKQGFMESRWVLVNPSGIAILPMYGREFKFHIRSFIYEYLEIDYLKITGTVHGTNYLDQVG